MVLGNRRTKSSSNLILHRNGSCIRINIHKNKTMSNLTELEKKVVNVIKDGDYYNGYPYMHPKDIESITLIDAKTSRGVYSSLIKKDIIEKLEDCNESFIYLLGFNEDEL